MIRALFLLSTLLASALSVSAQESLRPGDAAERILTAGDAHAYSLDLPAGQFVLGVADQHTVDVVVTLAGPDGARIQQFDNPARGPEPFQFVTESAGTHTLTVTPYGAEGGRYTMRLDRVEPLATTPAGTADQLFAGFSARSPGAAVAVVQGGETTFANGYGSANLEYGEPVTPESVFYIGSVGKQFTAFAIALLADQGTLSLDAEVRTLIPELDLGRPVSVRQLLHHTSGMRDTFGLLALAGGQPGDLVTQDIVRDFVLRQRGLNYEPGTAFSYSNANYFLLAEIVERVTGESFRSWMQDNVFGPLGMSHTFVGDDHREIIPNRATSYAPEGGGYATEVFPFSAYGAGGIYSTARDMAQWLRNFGTAQVGGPAVAQQMRERGVLANGDTLTYALALFVDEHQGLQRIQHGGALAGYRSYIAYYPEIDAGVVVLGNVSSLDSKAVGNDLAEAFFASGDTEAPGPASVVDEVPEYDPASFDPSTFDAFAGRYELGGSPGYTVRVDRRGDGYIVQLVGQPEWDIAPVGPATFSTQGGLRITFDVSPDGSVETITAPRLGDEPAFRIPTEPDALVPDEFAGRYYSGDLDVVYTVRAEQDGLVVVRPRGHAPTPLVHSAGGRFLGQFPVLGVAFERDADGAVNGFTTSSVRTQGVRFEKVD